MLFVPSMRVPRAGRDPATFAADLDRAAAAAALAEPGHTLCEFFSAGQRTRLYLDYDVYCATEDATEVRAHKDAVARNAREIALVLCMPDFAIAARHGRKGDRYKVSFRVFFRGFSVVYHDIPVLLRWLKQDEFWDLAPYKKTEQLLAAINGCKGAGDARVLRAEPEFADRSVLDFVAAAVDDDDLFLNLEAFAASRDVARSEPPPAQSAAIPDVAEADVRALVDLLAPARATDRRLWIGVGLVLKRASAGSDALFRVFADFSRRATDPAVVADDAELRRQWDSFRTDSPNPLTLASLAHWARQDAPDRYRELATRTSVVSLAPTRLAAAAAPAPAHKAELVAALQRLDGNLSFDDNSAMEVDGHSITVRAATGELCEVDSRALTVRVEGRYRGMLCGGDIPVSSHLGKVHKRITPDIKEFVFNRPEFDRGTLVSRAGGVALDVHDPFTTNTVVNLRIDQRRNTVINSARAVGVCNETILRAIQEYGKAALPGCFQLFNNCTFVLNAGDPEGALEDTVASDKFMEWFHAKGFQAVKCSSIFYIYNPKNGVYKQFTGQRADADLRDFFFALFKECGEGVLQKFAKSTCRMKALLAQVRSSISENNDDPHFLAKADIDAIGRMPFSNGIYDFKEARLLDFTPDIILLNKLPHKFPVTDEEKRAADELGQQIMDRVVTPIWDDCGEYVLRCSARCAAAEVKDKTYFMCLGNGNSGKGVWMDTIESAFPGYVGIIVNSNLVCTPSASGDQTKFRSWMLAVRHCRFNFTSEIKIAGNTSIDGNVIKELSNGGEKLCGRQNNKDETNFMLHGMTWSFANDIPKIRGVESDDGLHNRLKFVPMKYRYLVGGEYEKYRNESNVRRGDENIKDWVKLPEIGAATAYLVAKKYIGSKPIPPDAVDQETHEWVPEAEEPSTPLDDIVSMAEDETSFVSCEDLHNAAKEKGLDVSKTRLGKMISSRFNKKGQNKRFGAKMVRGFYGLVIVTPARSTSSAAEDEFARDVQAILGQRPQRNIRPNWLRNPNTSGTLEIDIFFPEHNLAIEFDGPQHHSFPNPYHTTRHEFENQVRLDELKNRLCTSAGVKLIRVRHDSTDKFSEIRGFLNL